MTETTDPLDSLRKQLAVAELHIGPQDVAVVNLPAGTTLRAVRDSGVRDYPDTFAAEPVVARVYGEAFGGAAICTYPLMGVRGIRNGNHRRDRAVWHEAARQVRKSGVVYVEHERRDWYGHEVWWAVRVRQEGTRP